MNRVIVAGRGERASVRRKGKTIYGNLELEFAKLFGSGVQAPERAGGTLSLLGVADRQRGAIR